MSEPLRERLYLRMTEWLILTGMSLPDAKQEAKKFAKNSPDPKWDLDVMRSIEDEAARGRIDGT